MLNIRNLTAGYDRRPAIHHLDAEIRHGSLVAIVGPNGGGKSTLLKTLMGLLKPMSGGFQFTPPSLRHLAYLPQVTEIDRSFPINVYDVVLMGCWSKAGLFKALDANAHQKAAEALELVGMVSFARQSISALSTGQFQRVLFARLITHDAEYYLLDEPFSAIDSRTSSQLLKVVENWHKNGKTVLCVSHDLEQVNTHFPQTMLLARELVGFGSTAHILTQDHLQRAKRMAESWRHHAQECDWPIEGTI